MTADAALDRRPSLVLTVNPRLLPEFHLLLQQGFDLEVRVGCSVLSLLCEQLGIPPDYVSGRITTIFHNSRAIDDLDATIIREGSRLTLSAAMPGLVGATMRCGGYYAAMRSAITHRENGDDAPVGTGTIRLKLFNLLLTELGAAFLAAGIGIGQTQFAAFLKERDEAFWEHCRRILIDGEPAEPQDIPALSGAKGIVLTAVLEENL